jgi:hypothetical protein
MNSVLIRNLRRFFFCRKLLFLNLRRFVSQGGGASLARFGAEPRGSPYHLEVWNPDIFQRTEWDTSRLKERCIYVTGCALDLAVENRHGRLQ